MATSRHNTARQGGLPRSVVSLFTSFLLLGLCSISPSHAQDPMSEAQALASEALAASRKGEAEAAIGLYRSALDLEPSLQGARFQLARLLAGLSRFEEARVEFAAVVAANPKDSAARRGEVTALLLLERWLEARTKLIEGLNALPLDGQIAHLLARLLASAPDDATRNGEGALEVAMAVYKVQSIPVVGETVAMAFAAIGEYEEAAKIQQQLIIDVQKHPEEYGAMAEPELMQERLETYQQGQAWRAKSPLEIVRSTELPASRQG